LFCVGATPRRSTSSLGDVSVAPLLIYDYGTVGRKIQRQSLPIMLGMCLFLLVLGVLSLFAASPSKTTYLSATLVLVGGTWMGQMWLHLRRDRHALETRYVLSDTGIEVSAADIPTQSLPWTQISAAHQSRLLRYFRLASPSLARDVVLIFGAPPKVGIYGQIKYAQTRNFIAAKLGDRLVKKWL
jgi:hypothetical protein